MGCGGSAKDTKDANEGAPRMDVGGSVEGKGNLGKKGRNLSEENLDKIAAAFIKHYVPGGDGIIDPAELQAMKDALKVGSPAMFAKSLLTMIKTEIGQNPNMSKIVSDKYFMKSMHFRNDQRASKHSHLQDTDIMQSNFIGNLLVGRFTGKVPKHVAMRRKADVQAAFQSIKKHHDGTYTAEKFRINGKWSEGFPVKDQDFLHRLHHKAKTINWDEAVVNCIAVQPYPDGSCVSPAWNGNWVVFNNAAEATDYRNCALWLLQGADAQGIPSRVYPGIGVNEYYAANAGAVFTPLADKENWYGYQLTLDPDTFDKPIKNQLLSFCVKCFYKDMTHQEVVEASQYDFGDAKCSEKMYLTVSNMMYYCSKKDWRCWKNENLINIGVKKIWQALYKGVLMYDIDKMYHPNGQPAKIFDRISLDRKAVGVDDFVLGNVMELISDVHARDACWLIPPGYTDKAGVVHDIYHESERSIEGKKTVRDAAHELPEDWIHPASDHDSDEEEGYVPEDFCFDSDDEVTVHPADVDASAE